MTRLKVVRMYKSLKAEGGVHVRLAELLPRLAEHCEVRLLCYRSRGEAADAMEARGVPVDLVPLGLKWAPWNLARYVKYLREHAPDVVHAHEYTANTLGIAAADRAGVPVRIRHLHTMRPWGEVGGAREAVRLRSDVRAARRASLTLAVSGAARREYLARTGLPPASCRVLHNAVDLGPFREAGARRADLRAGWGVADDAPLLGVVGRLGRGKGHPEFLRAAAAVSAELPAARFAVVGEGGARGELEALARALGIADRVVFTGHRGDVPEVLAALDLFVFASPAEGFGTAVVEALAAGLPVVAFRLPALEEIVEDGATGRLVPLGDTGALARAAVGYLRDRSAAAAAGRRGREAAEAFSLDRYVTRTLELYEELLRTAGRWRDD